MSLIMIITAPEVVERTFFTKTSLQYQKQVIAVFECLITYSWCDIPTLPSIYTWYKNSWLQQELWEYNFAQVQSKYLSTKTLFQDGA